MSRLRHYSAKNCLGSFNLMEDDSQDDDDYTSLGSEYSDGSDNEQDAEDEDMEDEEEGENSIEPSESSMPGTSKEPSPCVVVDEGHDDSDRSDEESAQDGSDTPIVNNNDESGETSNTVWEPDLRLKHDVTEIAIHSLNPDCVLLIQGAQSSSPEWFFMRDVKTAYLVSKQCLDSKFPSWRSLGSKTSQLTNANDTILVREFRPGISRLVMVFSAIAHGKRALVDDMQLQLHDVAELAKLSYTYKGLHLIKSWIAEWTKDLLDEEEDLSEEDPYNYHQEVEKIWIAYEFGLEQLFLKTCFQLSFISSTLIPSSKSLPLGLHERVYACRSAYILEAMKQPWACLKDLRDAKAKGGEVSSRICRKKLRKCLTFQIKALEEWFSERLLPLVPVQLEEAAKLADISPLQICVADSLDTDGVCEPEGRMKCRLGVLAEFLDRGGTGGYLHHSVWSLCAGDKARPATEDHIKYMENQRKIIATNKI